MQNYKIKISDSNNVKADSLILLLERVAVNLFKLFISFDEKSLSRCFVDRFSIVCRSFLDCLPMTSPCCVLEVSLKARLNNSDSLKEFISAIPMGYFKKIPQYMPRAPD